MGIEWIIGLGAFVAAAAGSALLVRFRDRQGRRIMGRLGKLRKTLVEPVFEQSAGSCRVDGRFHDRRVSVRIQHSRDPRDASQFLVLDAPRSFHLLVESKAPDSSRMIEVFDAATVFRTGIDELDRQFTIASRYREDCVRALARPGLAAVLEELFRDRYQTIRLENGRLEAKLWFAPLETLSDAKAIRRRIELLYQLCELLVQISVRELDRERLRDVTCPYCRDAILKEPRVVACGRCHTPHHGECWNEAQGCSVYGCPGGEVVRLEARDRR